MKELISSLGLIPSASGPMKIFCDNTGAIALAKESRFHKRTKHIKRRFNSICDQVKEEDINICKVHMDLNVADPLTKPLPRAKHDQPRTLWVLDSLPCNTRLLTLVQVGDCWKYAPEAIIKWLLLYFLLHDNRVLSIL